MKLVFFGAPGAGKGTIAKMLHSETGIVQVSTGDLFRENIKNKTPLGEKIAGLLAKGELVPDSLTIDIVKERVGRDDCKKGYILDGFPRTLVQAEEWEKTEPIDKAVYFQIEDETVKKRLGGRRLCKSCGAIFNIEFSPSKKEGICDVCGGELYTRDDDKPESVENRLKIYHDLTKPLLAYYTNLNKMISVDASVTTGEVSSQVKEAIKG